MFVCTSHLRTDARGFERGMAERLASTAGLHPLSRRMLQLWLAAEPSEDSMPCVDGLFCCLSSHGSDQSSN